MSRGDQYEIEWASPAQRAVRRLPEKTGTAIVEFIYGQLAANPRRAGHGLRLELEGHHSASRGDFRIIYRIDEDHRVVVVETIAHRSNAYRPR